MGESEEKEVRLESAEEEALQEMSQTNEEEAAKAVPATEAAPATETVPVAEAVPETEEVPEVEAAQTAPVMTGGVFGEENTIVVEAPKEEKKPGILSRLPLKKIGIILGISAAACLIVGYFIMVTRAKTSFMPGVHINGIDVAGMTPDEVKGILKKEGSQYQLNVHFRNQDIKVDYRDIDYVQDYSKAVDALWSSKNPYTWFLQLEDTYETCGYEQSYDKELLRKRLFLAGCLDPDKMISPENPSIEYQEGEYKVVENNPGTLLDPDEVLDRLDQVIQVKGNSYDVEAAGLYAEPQYKKDAFRIERCVNEANKYLNREITYWLGEVEIPLSKNDLVNIIQIDKNYNCSISEFQIGIYVQNLAETYDTYKKAKAFYTYYGKRIEFEGERYGWLLDTEEEYDKVKQDILSDEPVERDLTTICSGATLRLNRNGNKVDDIGDTYAEVDLEKQHVWLYSQGSLVVDSDCVTGCVSLKRSTPGGIFTISYTERDTYLEGEDYRTPVSYWMPFNGGIGFHDATWRGAFGGQIYQYDGSHGCVNLPIGVASVFYDYTYAGMPVIVY